MVFYLLYVLRRHNLRLADAITSLCDTYLAYDYMAAGLPIVNSLWGEPENLLRVHQMGIQYQAGDPKSLAEALESLARDEKRRKTLALNSYNIAMQFDKHVQYQKFADLIEKLCLTSGD